MHSTFFYTFTHSYLLMTLFHSFTFANAQGTDLGTGRVAISCFRPTHSARNVARNVARNARLHCNSLFHGFTFLYAQGTDLRTGTVTISCFRPTHSARNVARNVARLPLFEPPGSQSLSLQDLSYTRHGRENRNSYYIMLQAYTFCEECCAECCEAPIL